jgi:hypothetical protein
LHDCSGYSDWNAARRSGYAVFALIADPFFYKLGNNPGSRAWESISVHHRGGTTMRTWTKLVPAVLLAMSMLAPVHADTPNNDKSNAEKIAELQKEMNDLKREVENLKRGTAQDIREIKDILRQLAQQPAPVVSRSAYSPGAGGSGNGGGSAPGTASVYLRNQYGANATFRINGQPYTVGPYRTTTVTNVPLGTITWEVSVDGHGLIVPSTPVSLTASGRTINVFPIQP